MKTIIFLGVMLGSFVPAAHGAKTSTTSKRLSVGIVQMALGGTIWDDLRDAEERRAEVRGLPRPETGPVEVYSPFSANLVVRADNTPQLITATRRVGPLNRYHPSRTSNFNPQMDAWYRFGAAIIGPRKSDFQ